MLRDDDMRASCVAEQAHLRMPLPKSTMHSLSKSSTTSKSFTCHQQASNAGVFVESLAPENASHSQQTSLFLCKFSKHVQGFELMAWLAVLSVNACQMRAKVS